MSFLNVVKKPTKTVDGVLNAFENTILQLEQVAQQHVEYAKRQRSLAEAAAAEADSAEAEADKANNSIDSLKKALGR